MRTREQAASLADLEISRAARDHVERQIRGQVAIARVSGCSWAQIGRALGVTAGAVWQRYATDADAEKVSP